MRDHHSNIHEGPGQPRATWCVSSPLVVTSIAETTQGLAADCHRHLDNVAKKQAGQIVEHIRTLTFAADRSAEELDSFDQEWQCGGPQRASSSGVAQ